MVLEHPTTKVFAQPILVSAKVKNENFLGISLDAVSHDCKTI